MTTELEAPVVEVLPDTTEKTVSLTQERLDAIIKERMGAAGKAAKEEAAALKLENQRLKEVAAGQGSTDELERIRGELSSARLESAAILEASVKQQKDLLIAQESAKHQFVDLDTLQRLTRSNLKHDPTTGCFIVTNDDGTPKLGADGTTPVPVSDFFQDFGNKKPWLVKGSVLTGTGQGGSGSSMPPQTKPLSHYFGPGSSSAAVNALSLRDPQTYKRLRAEAVRAGLVS
jgi:hypothetical protein